MQSKTAALVLTSISIPCFVAIGIYSLYFGHAQESVTLFGFGLANFIEVVAATLVAIKLLRGDPERYLRFEKAAIIVEGTLSLQLTFVIVVASFIKLSRNEGPGDTLPGIYLSLISLILFAGMWLAKKSCATKMNSQTVMGDAQCALNCVKISLTLLLSSLVYYFIEGLWWVDNFAALFLSFQIGKEGLTLIKSSRRGDFQASKFSR